MADASEDLGPLEPQKAKLVPAKHHFDQVQRKGGCIAIQSLFDIHRSIFTLSQVRQFNQKTQQEAESSCELFEANRTKARCEDAVLEVWAGKWGRVPACDARRIGKSAKKRQ